MKYLAILFVVVCGCGENLGHELELKCFDLCKGKYELNRTFSGASCECIK